ncbi:MAG: hypothetical protein WKF70_13475, partial [Chitinophagaceae bacterium]
CQCMNHKNPQGSLAHKVLNGWHQFRHSLHMESPVVLLLTMFALACQNASVSSTGAGNTKGDPQSKSPDSTLTMKRPPSLSGCYQMTLKEDTALLEITVQDGSVTGTLVYLFKEKDKNRGELRGVVNGEYIYADYTFYSEGTTSTREIAFKIKDQALVPGFGDIIQKNLKIVFTNKDALQFQYETPFLKLPCPG